MSFSRRTRLFAARLALASASLALFAPAVVVAQGGEPHGFVEPCTIANHQEMHTECELCAVPAQDPEVCSRRLGKLGYAKKCQTNPHSAAPAEVWCVATAALAASSEKAKAAEPTGKLIIAIAVTVTLVGLFFFAKRRRPKSDEAA